jgi:hypothetical protein
MHHAGGAAMALTMAMSFAPVLVPFTLAAAASMKVSHHSFSCESCHEEKIRITHDLSRYILKDF